MNPFAGDEITSIDDRDSDRLRHCVCRSAMVLIAWELDRLMGNPGLPVVCSAATLNLLERASRERREDGKTTKATVMFARRAAQLAASISWPSNSEIGPERCDA